MKNNLKKLIAENNANIEEVAKETGIGRTTIYQIMNTKCVPNVEYAFRLSKYFNVLIEELFFSDEEK
ncbi:helix-turn-helix transcriptional regulator [Clostridium butyricum]|uniref:HTH cro/C1-type domain-containing protein n=1 Tax=Clostridium butyricum TaxID=1492 RepID=A0A2S7FCQ3_CLOBU|nr:helix-turn-helix domain-containing protein [Clostridium butyricum]KHD14973.1 hypothetical protein OA81_12815 [Clostridium butyricum]PPV16038.1 hypothetical protein AWN73_10850 [Clostridium butyricum]